MCVYICIYIYIYIYICLTEWAKRREYGNFVVGGAKRASGKQNQGTWQDAVRGATVSFHSFKSQNFKLSVSNAKSKYVAYSSVLSQFSNCQGLGRKNKHEILKADRRWELEYLDLLRDT